MNISSLVALFLFFLVGCNSSDNKDDRNLVFSKLEHTSMNYKKAIDTISVKVVDLTAPSDLFSIAEFLNIYENSSTYIEDALLFISDSVNSVQKKQIAIYSMQNLSDNLYINFSSSVTDLFIEGIVSEELLQIVLFKSINERYKITKNYKDKRVIDFLSKVKSFSNDMEVKRRIDNLLSGKEWEKLSDFIENQ